MGDDCASGEDSLSLVVRSEGPSSRLRAVDQVVCSRGTGWGLELAGLGSPPLSHQLGQRPSEAGQVLTALRLNTDSPSRRPPLRRRLRNRPKVRGKGESRREQTPRPAAHPSTAPSGPGPRSNACATPAGPAEPAENWGRRSTSFLASFSLFPAGAQSATEYPRFAEKATEQSILEIASRSSMSQPQQQSSQPSLYQSSRAG